MRLTLAVPDLLAQDRATLAAASSLARLAHYAGAPVVQPGGLDAFLASDSATPGTAGTAPLAALGAGFDPGAAYVLRADPVSLVAGRADVMLAARIGDLDAEEAGGLIATLNAHFGRDGLKFHAPRPDAWFVAVDARPDLATKPLSAVRGSIYPHLPVGRDSATWRRWLSEMQMLLHEHPVNEARGARGSEPVTGIWISEGGVLADLTEPGFAAILSTPGRAGDVARGLARWRGIPAPDSPANFASLPKEDNVAVVLDGASDAQLLPLERQWLLPVVIDLERGTLASLTLLADGNGAAAAWRAQRPGWTTRAVAKFSAPAFVPPSPDEEDA